MNDTAEIKKNFEALCESIHRLTRIPLFLIIEDNLDDAIMLRHSLESYFSKCQILTCNNGNDALTILATQNIDAIFLDLALPDIDGLEVMKRMKLIQINKPSLIIVTGLHKDSPLTLGAIKLGAVKVIAKPVTQEDLENAFKTV